MENEFVPYELAIALRELGFAEEALGFYPNKVDGVSLGKNKNIHEGYIEFNRYPQKGTSAPLYQQAFRWFRVKYDIDGRILPWSIKKNVDGKLVSSIVWYYSAEKLGNPSRYKCYECSVSTPEEAELACLCKLIELVKNKTHE